MANPQDGTIKGWVADDQDERLPGVTLTLEGNPPRVEVSDANGNYRFLGLTPGTYVLFARLEGFDTYYRDNIVVGVGQTVTLDLTLSVAIGPEVAE